MTPDWTAARESVRKLAALKPEIAVTGHGLPMIGDELRDSLDDLAKHFDQIAVLDYGKYV